MKSKFHQLLFRTLASGATFIALAPLHAADVNTTGTTIVLNADNPQSKYIGNGTLQVSGGAIVDIATLDTYTATEFAMTGGLIDIVSGTQLYNGGWQKGIWTANKASLNVAGTLDLRDGNPVIVDALTGAGSVTISAMTWSPILSNTITIGANGGGGTFGGVISELGLKKINLIKNGGGTQIFSNTSTYTGATTVTAGTLKVSGSIGSSNVTVNGGILASGSTGTVGKVVTVNTGAKFAAGDVGTVGAASVASDLNFSSGSIFDWDLTTGAGNGTYDTVNVSGSLNITSGAKFNVVSSTAFSDPFWNSTHTWSNIFGAKTIDNFLVSNFQYSGSATAPSAEGSFSVSGSSLTWTAVPEPTSALAGLLITAGLLRRRRA